MALNTYLHDAKSVTLPVPAETESGDPVVVGDLPGVALIDRDAAGEATLDTGGAYKLVAKGIKKGGNAKIEVGDIVYLAAGLITANNEEGARFGYALEAVAEGEEKTIAVKVGY